MKSSSRAPNKYLSNAPSSGRLETNNQPNMIMSNSCWVKSCLIISAIISLVLIASGCDGFVDTVPKGEVTDENFWKTEEDAIAASNALYYRMNTNDNMYGRGNFWYINASDDMVTGRSDAGSAAVINFTATGDEGRVRDFYGYAYEGIQISNNILRRVTDMDINQDVKDRILGEAYFMRGFYMFQLAYLYGDHRAGVPIVTLDNMDDEHHPRADHIIDNYEFAASDFMQAIELLPYFTEYSDDNKGRAHVDAANGYLAKTYLYWGHYDDSKWPSAVEAANKVINSPTGRSLINTGNPEEDFHSVFYVENNWGSEYIWSVVSGQNTGSILPGVMLENQGWGQYNGWGYFQPTLDLYNHFEDGDHRREATILEFGDEFMYLGEERRYFSVNSWTGFQFNKYMQPYRYPQGEYLNPNGNKPTTDLNVPLMRFAEVLLIKSEAQIMQGLNGDEGINLVRERVGLTSITNADLEDLKRERRSELAGEFADRHADLVRWGDAEEAYSQPQLGREHINPEDPDSGYEIVEVWPARDFDPNVHHVWPIPPRDLAASGIEQNEGW